MAVTNNHVRYFATICITGGTYAVINPIIAWCGYSIIRIVGCGYGILTSYYAVAYNLGSETKRATGIPLYMVIGQCGAVLGSHLYPLTEGPRYMYERSLASLGPSQIDAER